MARPQERRNSNEEVRPLEDIKPLLQLCRKLFARGLAGTEVMLRFLKSGDIREQPLRSIDRADFITQPRGI